MTAQAVIQSKGAKAVRCKRKPKRSQRRPTTGERTMGRTVEGEGGGRLASGRGGGEGRGKDRLFLALAVWGRGWECQIR